MPGDCTAEAREAYACTATATLSWPPRTSAWPTSIRAIAAESGGAEAFIGNVLAPAAAILDDLRHARHAGSPHSAEITRTLGYLLWLPASDWVPAAMLWWLGKGKDPAQLARFLQALDRLAYGLRILGLGSNRRTQRFGSVITAIRNGADLEAAGSPLALSREELRNIDYNLKDLHARSAPLCRLVLLRLNDEIAGSRQSLPLDELTVEHVLPKKPGPGSQWRSCFPDAQERDPCTQALGNLVVVTKAQNDKAANLDFARKHAIYFATAGAPTPAINEYVRGQKEWTPAQVRERDADLRGDDPETDLADLACNLPIIFRLQIAGDDGAEDRVKARFQFLRQARDLLRDIINPDHGGAGEQAEDGKIEPAAAPFSGVGSSEKSKP